MEQPFVDETEVQPTEPLKGYYKTLKEALGPDSDLIHNPETSFAANPTGLSEGDRLLCANWQGAEVRHFRKDESEYYRTYIHRELEDGRSVHIVSSFAKLELDTKTGREVQFYQVEKLIFTGAPQVECVNFCETDLPEGVTVAFQIGDFDFEDGTKSKPDSHMAFRWKARQIIFNTIDKALDIGSLAHERGHAVSHYEQTESEKDIQFSAYMLMKEGKKQFRTGNFSGIESLEEEYGLKYQLARYVVAKEEQKASALGLKWLEKYQKPLRINAELMARVGEDNERALITYDAPFLPDVTVASKIAKQVDIEKAELIWKHLEAYADIRYWLKEHDISEGGSITIPLDTGKALIKLESKGWITFNFDPNNPDEDDAVLAIIVPINTSTIVRKAGEKEWREYDLNISSPEEFIKGITGARDVVEIEEDVVKLLVVGMIKREDFARGQCDWLKAIFKPNFSGIEGLDPITIADYVLSGKTGTLSKTSEAIELEIALQSVRPISRWNELCNRLGNLFLRTDGRTVDKYRFDPQTGRELIDGYDKLVTICQECLKAVLSPDQIPDRYLSTNPAETDLRILELAAQNFHQLTDNRYLKPSNT